MKPEKIAELRRRASPSGLTPKQVAHALGGEAWGWTSKRLRRLAREGKIEAINFGGRWRIPRSTIDELKAAQDKTLEIWEVPRYE